MRGDKVLWMCGAHTQAPEGESRIIKTHGDVEPCKLQLKAKAPLRKFHGLKELVNCCDNLVEELKTRMALLSGIFGRSDAMLAVYPGKRFLISRFVSLDLSFMYLD